MANRWVQGLIATALVLFLGVALHPGVFAQDAASRQADAPGAIAGVVVDDQQGEPLPGANVSIRGTTTGTSTDLNGRYRLGGLEPGTYDVLYSFVGFQQKTVTGVEVSASETTRIEVTLAEQAAELDEVVIEAAAARDSEAGLLKQRSKANAVSNAISAETIGQAGAGNAADAMKKVTGASIVEGRYVNVRGLQGRYVNTQLNGSELPSTDPSGNSVALDVFPSNVIDNIVTTKTFTPDKPGNFTGGSIDINTKSVPDDLSLSLSTSSSYNSEVGVGGTVLRPSDGLDAVPAVARQNQANLPASLGQTLSDPQARALLNRLSRSFATPVSIRQDEIMANRGAQASFGNRFEVGGSTLGLISSLSYDKSFSGYERGSTSRFNQVGLSAGTLNPTARYTTTQGTEETLWGGLLGVTFLPSPKHELGGRLLYNQDDEEEATLQSGSLPRDNLNNFRSIISRTIERTVRSGRISGTHRFGGGQGGVRLRWKSSLSDADRTEPDYRFFSFDFDVTGPDTTYNIQAPQVYPRPSRYFRDLSEQTWSNDLSLEVPVGEATLTVGGTYQTKTREFRERRFDYYADEADFEGDPNDYVTDKAGLLEEGGNQFGTYLLEIPQASNNYDGDQVIGAGFVMVEAPVPGVPNLEFIGGLRVEYTDMSIATIEEDPESGSFTETDPLPSANLVWSPLADMNARLAYGRTIARPTFREFAPFSSFEFIADYIEVGNPDLTRTRVNNFDLRWEWFTGPAELLSASVFYKEFRDPIEREILPRSQSNDRVTYQNKDDATVFGLELEVQQRLGGLASWLEHVKLGGNLTLTQSEISRSEAELEAIRAFEEDPSTTRQLQGQSPFIVNLNAGYENPESGMSINVFFNRFGDRLQTVTRNGVDLFERGRSILDIIASQRLLRNVEVKASVKNVLGTEYEVSQSFRGQTFVNDRYPLGRTVSVGLSYDF